MSPKNKATAALESELDTPVFIRHDDVPFQHRIPEIQRAPLARWVQREYDSLDQNDSADNRSLISHFSNPIFTIGNMLLLLVTVKIV